MIGRIHNNIFFQEHLMLNGVEIKIKLIRSIDTFCLMGADGAKLTVIHTSLFVRKIRLSLSLLRMHAKDLKTARQNIP